MPGFRLFSFLVLFLVRSTNLSLGETAYSAFRRSLLDRSETKDVPMPEWEELTPAFQYAWQEAADKVNGAVLRDLRDQGVTC